jgi:hypothetical protein
MDALEQLARSGFIQEWVQQQRGQWDHPGWLDFLRMATDKFGPLPVDRVGLLLEEEKKRYWDRTTMPNRPNTPVVVTQDQLTQVREQLKRRWQSLGFDGLLQAERDWIVLWWLKVDTENGSFHQYFFNPSGDGALLALEALQRLQQPQTHRILSDALACFGPAGYSPVRHERQQRLRLLPDGVFDGPTEAFYKRSEAFDLIALVAVQWEYERANPHPTPGLSLSDPSRQLLAALESAVWFAGVGQPLAARPAVARVASWEEAFEAQRAAYWYQVINGAADRLAAAVRSRSLERYSYWNDYVRAIKAMAYPLVVRKLEATGLAAAIAAGHFHGCRWVVLHACLECEYADLVPPGGFFHQTVPWYQSGHYPCGWLGEFPEGQLIVY